MKNVHDFIKKKQSQQKISMITCYDYTSAKIVAKTQIDCVLIGDSASMVMLGKPNTTSAIIDEMILMTQAVSKGIGNKFIIADMPFMSYRKSLPTTIDAVTKLIQAGAQAIKLEGAIGNFGTIQHIIGSGVPVMGHIGLTPQHIHMLGGFKVQGKTQTAQTSLVEQAKQLEAAGCFAIVLECIPWQLAKEITISLRIPTIGIGAGASTDGQVLVLHDLLGLQTDFKPKFVKHYLNAADLFIESINQFVQDVQTHNFPLAKHSYEGENHEMY